MLMAGRYGTHGQCGMQFQCYRNRLGRGGIHNSAISINIHVSKLIHAGCGQTDGNATS